uniref:VMO1 protein n=1 Tax=Cyanoderma ruficeps TaxID=181631 RepID=A0A8C3NY46_9PASS
MSLGDSGYFLGSLIGLWGLFLFFWPPRGLWDDTAANALAAICSGGSVLEGRGGPQGTWGNWSLPCPPGAGVCGLRTRLEPPQRGGDDTGLNDVDLYCCS